jgi:predicted phosphodiesterase
MKILVLSDLHNEFVPYEPPASRYDVVVLAGDIHSPASRAVQWGRTAFPDRDVVFVPGNHEFYGGTLMSTLSCMQSAAIGTRIRALSCSEAVIRGVRFLGCTLWTDFALRIDTDNGPVSDPALSITHAHRVLADFRAIGVTEPLQQLRKLTPLDTLLWHKVHHDWLDAKLKEPFDGPTVVVTHHGPHRNSLAAKYKNDWASGAFVSELPARFFETPVLWVHGHTHSNFDYHVGKCRVVCNPRGYFLGRNKSPENPSFNPSLIVKI